MSAPRTPPDTLPRRLRRRVWRLARLVPLLFWLFWLTWTLWLRPDPFQHERQELELRPRSRWSAADIVRYLRGRGVKCSTLVHTQEGGPERDGTFEDSAQELTLWRNRREFSSLRVAGMVAAGEPDLVVGWRARCPAAARQQAGHWGNPGSLGPGSCSGVIRSGSPKSTPPSPARSLMTEGACRRLRGLLLSTE
jgi:hypothetical protein